MKKIGLGLGLVVALLVVGVAVAQNGGLSGELDSPLSTEEVGTVTPTPTPGYPPPGDEWPSEWSLPVVLLWLFELGGAAAVSYWLMGNVRWLDGLSAEWKRYISMGLAALIACAAFVAAVAVNYVPEPDGGLAWLEKLFAVAGLAIFGGQALHGRLQLRARLYEMLGVAQVTVTSADLVRMFIGDAAEDMAEFVNRVEAAGGIQSFINEHAFYSSLTAVHRAHVAIYYASAAVRNTMRDVRQAADAAAQAAGLPALEGAWED